MSASVWAGEQRCEGNENATMAPVDRVSMVRPFSESAGQASLPCLYSFSKLCVKPSGKRSAVQKRVRRMLVDTACHVHQGPPGRLLERLGGAECSVYDFA